MPLERGFDGSDPAGVDPVGRMSGPQEIRKVRRSTRIASGTLACPACDAPVAPPSALAPADPLRCPYCDHAGLAREFLSLAAPSRPARVDVRVVRRR